MENDPWDSLRKKLEDESGWPRVYMFKFIVPATNQQVALVEELFNANEAEINLRQSSKGNYVSITAKELMMSPEAVIDRYKDAARIEGLIAL